MDVGKWTSWFAFDSIGEIVLSQSFQMLENEKWHHIVVLFRGAMFTLRWLGPLPWLAHIGLRLFFWVGIVRKFVKMKEWCITRIRERREVRISVLMHLLEYSKTSH